MLDLGGDSVGLPSRENPQQSEVRFVVEATRPVAYNSPDHLMPHGTKRDNSRNLSFNRKLALLFPDQRLHVLDVGCSGGGFVKSCLDEGHVSIGLDGSDYSLRHARAEWATIPDNLFTCDVTADFTIKTTSDPLGRVLFDVITAWEVMEHIHARDLSQVCENMKRHLKPGGLWIMSVAPIEDVINGVALHQTVQGREWWRRMFAEQGFENHPELVRYFGDDWVRGRFQGAPASFHLVLTRKGESAPCLPAISVRLGLATSSAIRYAPERIRLLRRAARSSASRVLRPVLKSLRAG